LKHIFILDFHEVRQPRGQQQTDCYKYVLIMVDQFSQYVTLCPTRDMTAKAAAQLIMEHIILKFGCFRYLISDRGSSWLNELFKQFLQMEQMKVVHFKTSPYHPQTNSRSELINQHLIRVLRAYYKDITQFHLLLPIISAAVNG
jgi:N-glycosylase/DNA lyase